MQVLYGTPLPPGLVAPTQGELRLRIDQLLLDDDAINHNPLVQLFEPDASATQHDASSVSVVASTRSPNRFVVPVDYCAVGPVFWGETRPTAQGQPSTPHLRRHPLTMAYPIKIELRQFHAYLQRMTASPQGGVLLDVFVPASYSGRPPVTIGKARLPLDHLQPGHPIQGWYPVLHRRSRAAVVRAADDGSAGRSESASNDTAEVKEAIAIGKVKVSVSIEYYPTTHQPHHHSAKHRRHVEIAGSGAAASFPYAKTRRSARHAGRAGALDAPSSSSSTASFNGEADLIDTPNTHRLHAHRELSSAAAASALALDLPTAARQLLEQGLRLRAQMDAAARGVDVSVAVPAFTEDEVAAQRRGEEEENATVSGVVADDGGDVADVDDEDGSSVYTSEASDEENFALQLQRDSEARDNRATQQQQQGQQTTPPHHDEQSVEQQRQQQQQQFSRIMTKSLTSADGVPAVGGATTTAAAAASVELCFSHFSFAQTPATADLRQLRLSVRLSADITTNEPTPGPLSSYVHPVPVQQSSICLHFDVCNYSEDRSKLVVEAYKVVAETEVEEETDAWDMRGPRQVAREELLGLSVVGLYRQSREVVFRDPVVDSSNVFAQLEIHVRSTSAAVSDHAVVHGGAARGSPASDAVPLGSIAGSSAGPPTPPPPLPQKQKSTMRSSHTTSPPPHVVLQELATDAADTSMAQPASHPLHASVPSVPTKSEMTSYVSVSERRRLRVVVHSAAELPRVALAQPDSRTPVRCPLVTSSPRVLPGIGVASSQNYTEPSTFVTIEEIFQSASSGLSGPERKREELAKNRARMQPMADWYVDEARNGYYDRSVVAEQSSNPHYGYEVLLQLPEVVVGPTTTDESVMSAATAAATAARDVSVGEAAHRGGTVDVLDELQVNVWHSDLSQHSALTGDDSSVGRAKTRQQEEQFWSCASYMGTCRVDLRPLRYLALINGYYRVVCERTPNNATDLTDADMEANTIGYMRMSVSLV